MLFFLYPPKERCMFVFPPKITLIGETFFFSITMNCKQQLWKTFKWYDFSFSLTRSAIDAMKWIMIKVLINFILLLHSAPEKRVCFSFQVRWWDTENEGWKKSGNNVVRESGGPGSPFQQPGDHPRGTMYHRDDRQNDMWVGLFFEYLCSYTVYKSNYWATLNCKKTWKRNISSRSRYVHAKN